MTEDGTNGPPEPEARYQVGGGAAGGPEQEARYAADGGADGAAEGEPEPRLPEPELQAVQRARFAPDAEADPDDPGVN